MLTVILPPYNLICIYGVLFAKIAVAIVSSGVIIATLFRPRTESPITIIRDPGTATNYTSSTDATTAASTVDTSRYTLGIAMLLASLVCTGVHGALQERTYSTYGPYWRESIFYTVRPQLLLIFEQSKYFRSKKQGFIFFWLRFFFLLFIW
jgi:UAA transporter family